ncbi:unnamed protein product [Aphanomyces euteiches]|uniref:tRNA threonylcarbamoyladenosine biosynthesis protein TsaE n=1 Tax=Aphanomyces euteiches TaxID=100861 RepID=A0A6G0X690_9STRA|nr:hypothetical protein Ae201684_008057 [Aphanomyces euteiches]KAH9074422.1 hypothetical protein Ae201684P_022229 [Aphanomyces euteiches]KAH9143105.1 hypothetical protein AeRB84_012871 [Aphanomyces euteiches]
MVLRARPLGRRLFSETHREIKGEEAMEHLGSSLALQVPKRAGNVLFLVGDLGCGKTCFARGFVRAWCQDEQLDVTSPTYLLINTYEPPVDTKRSTLYHLDLYRLESVTATDAQALGLEDVFSTGTSIVEWPDRLQDKPAERLEVHIEYTDAQDERRVRVEGYGSVWKPVEDLFRVN